MCMLHHTKIVITIQYLNCYKYCKTFNVAANSSPSRGATLLSFFRSTLLATKTIGRYELNNLYVQNAMYMLNYTMPHTRAHTLTLCDMHGMYGIIQWVVFNFLWKNVLLGMQLNTNSLWTFYPILRTVFHSNKYLKVHFTHAHVRAHTHIHSTHIIHKINSTIVQVYISHNKVSGIWIPVTFFPSIITLWHLLAY